MQKKKNKHKGIAMKNNYHKLQSGALSQCYSRCKDRLPNEESGEQKTVPVAQCTDTAIDVWYATDYLEFNPQKR